MDLSPLKLPSILLLNFTESDEIPLNCRQIQRPLVAILSSSFDNTRERNRVDEDIYSKPRSDVVNLDDDKNVAPIVKATIIVSTLTRLCFF